MTDAVETMAWTGQKPWHGLGFEVGNDLTPIQMLRAAKLNWKVSKEPVYQAVNGVYQPITDTFALTRDKDQAVLTIVGSKYKPVQNEEAFEFFKQFCEAGDMKMETAGSLMGGRYVWALARLGRDFALGKGKDEVDSYLLLMSPHVFGKALVAQYTSVRVVCWNTLNMALGSGLKGKAGAFRMPHSVAFNDTTKTLAKAALNLGLEAAKEFEEAAKVLSKAKASADKVEEFFFELMHFDPNGEKVRVSKKTGEVVEPRLIGHFRTALESSPGADLPSAKGTWWGALNAITFVIDHKAGHSRDSALSNAWIGYKANVKRRALELALKQAS